MKGHAFFFSYVTISISTLLIAPVNAKVVPYLQAGFSFDYSGPATISIPITAQCETIHLKWARGNLKGLPPVAPYFFQVFSSSLSSPAIVSAGFGPTFDWTVPFAPQSQYQICMYDSVGTSGGCEAIRTIVPSTTPNVTCQNITSSPQLSASTSLSNPTNPLQTPVINQCDIFSVQPTTGTGPFTLTISPSGHPPANLTGATQAAVDWTVALPEGFPFFASLSSSDGLSWSQGPFTVGGTGSSDCLSPNAIPKSTFTASTVGGGLGGFVVGGVLGAIIMVLVARCKAKRQPALKSGTPSLTKPSFVPDYASSYQFQDSSRQPSVHYPPPQPTPLPESRSSTPPMSPGLSTFLDHDPFAGQPPPTPRSRSFEVRESIVPFTDASPSSPHFPLDTKTRQSQISQETRRPDRTPSLLSYTTFASTSDYNQGSIIQSRSSQMPLSRPVSASTRSSRPSRPLGRAPTYTRQPHLTATPERLLLPDEDSMIGPGDVLPQYMRNPAEEEISVSGGAL